MVRDPNMGVWHDGHAGCAALAMAAESVLAQCESLILHVGDGAYTSESRIIRGGTLGKHLRHTLDHFEAALRAIGEHGEVISYDDRRRDVPMETSRGAAIAALAHLRDQLVIAADEGMDKPVRVRVMLDGDGREAVLSSTLGRELAFATHHAIHHQAMMKAIAAEFGVATDACFGLAPSSVRADGHARPA
jgi:uncharacterized damage-inducible protein DinB